MKYCVKCQKEVETNEEKCPICNEQHTEINKEEEVDQITEDEVATIVSTSTLLM